jgi:acyl carrier protein
MIAHRFEGINFMASRVAQSRLDRTTVGEAGKLEYFGNMSLRDIILDEIRRIAKEHKKSLGPLDDAVPLLATGLDSLCFAVLVVRLEETLKVEPFSDDGIEYPTTLGELIGIYENAAPKA